MLDGSSSGVSNSPPHRSDDVSVLIPTKNRPHFLLDLLNYYKARRFKGNILIGDSSSPDIFNEISDYISRNLSELNIELFHFPDTKPGPVIKRLLNDVVTNYIVLLSDDDFVLPNSISRCIDFLESNPEYSAAHGKGLLMNAEFRAGRLDVSSVQDYRQAVCMSDSSAGRVREIFANYAVSGYSVCRREVLIRVLNSVPDSVGPNYNNAFYDEIIQVSLTAALGKIAELDILHLIRLDHGERGSFGDFDSWMTQPSWHPSYSDFINKTALLIKEIDGVPYEDALDSANHAFSLYINSNKNRNGSNIGIVGVIRRFVHRYRLFAPIREKIRLLRFRMGVKSYLLNDDFNAMILSIRDSGRVQRPRSELDPSDSDS